MAVENTWVSNAFGDMRSGEKFLFPFLPFLFFGGFFTLKDTTLLWMTEVIFSYSLFCTNNRLRFVEDGHFHYFQNLGNVLYTWKL